LLASDLVVEEAGRGDTTAAARRLEALSGIPLLAITDEVLDFSKTVIQAGGLSREAAGDSIQIALSAVHGVDYLLSWNYRHVDNAETKTLVRSVCLKAGYEYPEICTPQELMGVYGNG
jgi:hypothetical protein